MNKKEKRIQKSLEDNFQRVRDRHTYEDRLSYEYSTDWDAIYKEMAIIINIDLFERKTCVLCCANLYNTDLYNKKARQRSLPGFYTTLGGFKQIL